MAKAAVEHAAAASRAAEAAAAAAKEAASIGNQGIAEIRSHQAVCFEQNKGVNDTMKDVKDSVKSLFRLVLICAGGLITGMGGVIVTLLLTGHHGI